MSDGLLGLQEIDVAMMRSAARRAVLESEEEARSVREGLEGMESALGELRLSLDQISTNQKRLEYDIDALTQKAAAEEKRLYDGSVANAKELGSMQHEIDNLKARRARMEDDLLELMESRESLESQIAGSEAQVSRGRTALETQAADSERELAEIAATLALQTAERARVAASIDPELLELYEDLRPQKKGVAAAALIDGICQGCHEKLSAMELDKLRKSDGIRRCDYCRRILVIE